MRLPSSPRSLNLCALFATLLSGCVARPGDDGGETDGEGTTAGTTDAMSTSATGTTDETGTTVTSELTTSSECGSNSFHMLALTPEELAHWLEHGEPPPEAGETGSTTGGSTTDAGTETGVIDTTDGTSGGTGGQELTPELCAEICLYETGMQDWGSVVACTQQGTDAAGDTLISCETAAFCEGRRHACLASRGAEIGDDPVGAFFARAAHDEAASVIAFIALERELAEHGAPVELLERIREAAGDEVRHARTTTALARRHGGRIQRPRRSATATRTLLEVARENAVEGCVRETWAALSAAHQAEHAGDPQIRAAMAVIASDEARHAELAWALDAWLQSVLSDSARAEVEAARRAAAAELVRQLATDERDATLVRRAGVPDRRTARRLSRDLADALWSAAAA